MESTTSASSFVQKKFRYDVFLSFRGEDTRKNFVDHLYLALVNKGVITYKDDEKIKQGERISDQLLRSIEESRFHIIVFSKNYASSSWCLDELVKIMECQRTPDHTAYPVFYDVEPTEIRNQSGAVGEAFAKHVEKEDAIAGRWRDALHEAADLAGWELKYTLDGHEAKFIQQVVQKILLEPHFISSSFDKNLVGMETRVKDVVSALEIDSDDVRMIGIWGMGGGGKTTLARAVFDHISMWFEGKSFVENVREGSKGSGLKELQKQVLQDVLNDQSIGVTGIYEGKNKLKKMMPGRKVLVVLDDVDDVEQLKALVGEPDWFKPGSKIIITTRDEQVLKAHGVNYIHDVSLLSLEEAICLFSRCAFKKEVPIQEYEELSCKVVYYANGLPLTITVLGSFLYGRAVHEWEDAIERLKKIPLKETLQKLELSYDGLDDDYKEIFLEVACILKGEEEDRAIRVLESCGFNAQIGLRILEQKSLITISEYNCLHMHDHIEEMGRDIVRRVERDEPNRHNRLWVKEEIEDILDNELGTKATRSIMLKGPDLEPTNIMKGLRKMKALRSLHVGFRYREMKTDEVGQFLPNTLGSLCWHAFPFRCLPKTFKAHMLVNLEMPDSKISQLWERDEIEDRNKLNLRFLDLQFSALKTFDLEMTPHLEMLNLEGCDDFVEINMTHKCPKLKTLELGGSKVGSLNLGLTPHLETLDLHGCNDFVELNMTHECPKLKTLNLSGSKVCSLNLGLTPHLETLHLEGCNDFVELNMTHECPKLKTLELGGSKVGSLNLGLTPHLETLDLHGCNDFVELNMTHECPKLKTLNLSGSKVCSLNLGLAPHLETLYLEGCNDFVELNMTHECPKLKTLNLGGSKVSSLNLGLTPNLETLYLEGCNDFVELNMTHECPNLGTLYLSGSKVSSLNLGLTPNLETLYLKGCNDFVELNMTHECPKLKTLNLSGSKVSILNLGLTPHLETLELQRCYNLQEIQSMGCLKKLVHLNLKGCLRFQDLFFHERTGFGPFYKLQLSAESLDKCPLHPNSILPKFQFTCSYNERVPYLSGTIERLLSFGVCACTNLESFSATICSSQHLTKLTLEGRIPEVLKDLGQIWSLEELTMSMKEIKHLPDSICMLKHLRSLELKSCWLLEKLPNDIDRLECLEKLDLTDCISLQDIPNSICNMKRLYYLNLSFCMLVEKLPKELGRLECLEDLDIEGAGISFLPQSIFQLTNLRIIGSRWQLESYGFTSCIKTWNSRHTACCHRNDVEAVSPFHLYQVSHSHFPVEFWWIQGNHKEQSNQDMFL
ncbi:hypothetical protein SSX86_007392 [Deinandra increscens subsp. villosa]|uniref:TIR domain-containing protein n=1 Tax=Deinandra increscens subsp. villosa TaxID=3103831 RepID=A0AAP0DHA0_9ASTR